MNKQKFIACAMVAFILVSGIPVCSNSAVETGADKTTRMLARYTELSHYIDQAIRANDRRRFSQERYALEKALKLQYHKPGSVTDELRSFMHVHKND